MKVILTANEMIERGFWHAYCDLMHIDHYVVANGVFSGTKEFTLRESQLRALGIKIELNRF